VPFAKLGILGSLFLGLARALGETMAVTMVIGNIEQVSKSLLSSGSTIASKIAGDLADSSGVKRSVLVELGLVLFGLTIVINGLARIMILATTSKGSARN
jgi:phosphate transport system permease protein